MITKDIQSNHWKKKNIKIVESYWVSPPATKRSLWFCDQLKNYKFNSIFEVGFFSGRNLHYINKTFKNIKIAGLEINPEAVRFAKSKINSNELYEMDLHNLNNIKNKYDIVFTSGVLIHVPPQEIESVILKMVSKANKYIMHIEDNGNNEVVAGPQNLNPIYKISDQIQFSPNLISIYNKIGFNYDVITLPDEVKTNGAKELIVVKV